MKLCLKILAISVIAATTYSMIGCGASPAFSYSNVSVNITSKCADCAAGAINVIYSPTDPGVELMPNAGQGGAVLLTANVTNAPPVSNVTWAIYPTNDLTEPSPLPTGGGLPVGESSPAGATGYLIVQSGNTAVYTNGGINIHTTTFNGSIPVYSGATLAQANSMVYTVTSPPVPTTSITGVQGYTAPQVQTRTGIPQGDVLIAASVPDNPDDPTSMATGYQLMQYYNENTSVPSLYLVPETPTSPSGLTTSVLTVPEGGTYQFYGGAVGAGSNYNYDNTVIWAAGSSIPNAVVGGSTQYGTISTTGLYTAPATVTSPTTVVVVMAFVHNPAENVYAYITLVP